MTIPLRPLILSLSLLTAAPIGGCSIGCSLPGMGDRSASSSADDFVARPGASRHEITGTVVKVDTSTRKVTIAHSAIPDYMQAMTMEFAVKEGWAFKAMGEGDTVRGTLIVDGARSWIEGISVTKVPLARTAPQGTWMPPTAGTPLPAVSLTDQDARPLAWDRFSGAPVVITFIYTRCPLPDYCPLMMQRLVAIEKATAGDPALARTRFLAVSVDPAFDTPAVLRTFGLRFEAGTASTAPFERLTLATGAPAEVKRLAGFFGLDYFEEGGQIMHALRTAIVDSRGRVYRVFEGNTWTVDDILRDLRRFS
jgi:protein SCO1/2